MSRYTITINGTERVVDVQETGPNNYSVNVDPTAAAAVAAAPAPAAAVAAAPVAAAPVAAAPAPAAAGPVGHAGKAGSVKAPMPGTIDSITVSVGDQIKKGDTVVVLEAMKMKNDLRSDIDGTVASINVSAGQQVKFGETLVTFE